MTRLRQGISAEAINLYFMITDIEKLENNIESSKWNRQISEDQNIQASSRNKSRNTSRNTSTVEPEHFLADVVKFIIPVSDLKPLPASSCYLTFLVQSYHRIQRRHWQALARWNRVPPNHRIRGPEHKLDKMQPMVIVQLLRADLYQALLQHESQVQRMLLVFTLQLMEFRW